MPLIHIMYPRFVLIAFFIWLTGRPDLHAQHLVTASPPPDLLKAVSYMEREAYEEALPLWKAAASRYESTVDTNAWVFSLSGLGTCYDTLGKYDQSAPLHAQAIALLQQKKTGLWDGLLSSACHAYALHYMAQGKSEQALQCLQKAMQAFEQQSVRPPLQCAELYAHLALVGERTFPIEQIELYYQRAFKYYQEAGAGMERQYRAQLTAAMFYYNSGDTEQALSYIKAVEEWADAQSKTALPRSFNLLQLYQITCYIYKQTRDYDKWLHYAQKMEYQASKKGIYHTYYVYSVLQLATLHVSKEEHEKAIPYLLKSIELADSVWKAPRRTRIVATSTLAYCYDLLNKREEAAQYWAKSMEEAERFGENRTFSSLYARRASVHKILGEHAQATAYFKKSLPYLEKVDTPKSQRARAQTNVAISLTNMGNGIEALPYAETALRLFLKYPSAHPDVEQAPDTSFRNDFQLLSTQTAWLQALLQAGKQTGDIQYFQRAWGQVEKFVRIQEKLRYRLQNTTTETYEWLQDLRLLYGTTVSLAYELTQSTQQSEYIADALRLSDRHKAIILQEKSQEVKAKKYAGIPDTLLLKETLLSKALTSKEIEINRLKVGTSNWAEANNTLNNLKKQKEAFVRMLEQQYPAYYHLKYELPSTDVAALRRALPEDALLVEYFLHPEEKQLYIFTVSKTSTPNLLRIPLDTASRTHIHELRQLAQSVLLTRPSIRQRFIETSHHLYQQLIQPIEIQLAHKSRLVIVPDGFLYGLPFELLLPQTDNVAFSQLPFLLKQVEISYQYSAALLLQSVHANQQLRPVENTQPTLLAFAPTFEAGTSFEEQAQTGTRPIFNPIAHAPSRQGYFLPLPYSEQEVKGIAALAGEGHSNLMLHQQANEANLKAELQKPYHIVHIATHSFANIELPRFSGIACNYTGNDTSVEDGVLYVNEIYNLTISADLVVLSSCDSGLGKTADGEGMLGLNRAFAYAGVHNIVYSLWKVNDKAGSELMIEFYKNVFAGKSYASALRTAKMKLLGNPTTAAPNFWGGFLFTGL